MLPPLYALFVAYNGATQFAMALAWAEVARSLPSDLYAGVGSIIVFLALVLQTVVQVAVGSGGLHLLMPARFVVFAVVGIVGTVVAAGLLLWRSRLSAD